MKWIQIARAVLLLFPALIEAMKALEEAIPGEGKGEQRLAVIRQAMEAAHSQIQDTIVKFEDIWPSLAAAIGGLVTAFNAFGWNLPQKEEVK